jgi:hypothetical protein
MKRETEAMPLGDVSTLERGILDGGPDDFINPVYVLRIINALKGESLSLANLQAEYDAEVEEHNETQALLDGQRKLAQELAAQLAQTAKRWGDEVKAVEEQRDEALKAAELARRELRDATSAVGQIITEAEDGPESPRGLYVSRELLNELKALVTP